MIAQPHAGLNSAFVARALGKREAARLAGLMRAAEERARARLATAMAEAEYILAEARAEAEAVLARLPDFAAIEAAGHGKGAFKAIRDAADRHGLAMAVVVGRSRPPAGMHGKARAARAEAMRAIAAACPGLTARDIAAIFSAPPPDEEGAGP